MNGTLFFAADDGSNGIELWKSDGTPAGTVLVKDINPGAAGSYPEHLTNVNGTLFFTADDGTTARAVEERRHAGRHRAGQGHLPRRGSSAPADLTNVERDAVLRGRRRHQRRRAVEERRHAAGTILLQDIAPGAANSNPAGLTIAGDLVFFGANSGDGQELWAVPIPSPAPARKYVYLPLVRR